jgi:8-oxo-dGTP diphosphatase
MEKHINIIPAVCLLLECDGKWFVGRRANTGYCDGCLNMPAGHIDADETPREAAVREAKEEVGVDVGINDITFVHVQYNRNVDGHHDRTHYYFKIEDCDLRPINTEPHKCSETLWLPAGEKLDEFVPFMGEALTAYLKGEAYSEFYEEKE